MASRTRVLDARDARHLGRAQSVLTIGEGPKESGTWAGRRLLSVSGDPAFELGFWCGTCPFLFERLEGSNNTLSIEGTETTLAEGLTEIDEGVVATFAPLLPSGEYTPLLLEVEPTLTYPMRTGDYFAEELEQTWRSSDGFWGLPEYPRTPYYRGDTRALDDENVLFEFVVPMVPPSWNDRGRVQEHAERLSRSSRPTCVTVSLLDVRQRAVANTPEEGLVHWGLAHFLLDGHHKIEAAAANGDRLQVLSFLSIEHSLADAAQIQRVIDSLGSA